jgi:hypothetical protein
MTQAAAAPAPVPAKDYGEHVLLSNATAERPGDTVEVSFDIEFRKGNRADDSYFLVVQYSDKSYDKWALIAVPNPRRYAAHPGPDLIPRGVTKGRVTRPLVQPKGDVLSIRVERREDLPGGRDGWPTVSNVVDVPTPR